MVGDAYLYSLKDLNMQVQASSSPFSAFPTNLVTIDPELVSGTPVFAGTRVPVKSLFDWLETETLNEFLENFPSVQRVQAVAVLRFAEYSFFTHELKVYETAA